MRKNTIVLIICIFMLLSSTIGTYAASVDERLENYKVDYEAQIPRMMKLRSTDQIEQLRILQDLKILQGTGNGLELDKGLTRAEGALIYLRLLGGQAFSNDFRKQNPNYKTGFIDIPDWALQDINYLYNNGLIKGLDSEKYGSNNQMTAEQFTTLILRGLGYKDTEGEFIWNQSLDKAFEIGLLNESEKNEIQIDKNFTREEMAKIAYNSLFIKIKDEPRILLSKAVLNHSYDGFTQIFYVLLDNDELAEFAKANTEKGYSVFPNNAEKKQDLMNKIKDYFDVCSEYYQFYLDDEVIKIEVISVDDAGNSKYSDYAAEYMNNIWTTTKINTHITGIIETKLYQPWTLEGNKLRIKSDTNYFGLFYHNLIVEYMKTRVNNLILDDKRLTYNFKVNGLDNFKREHDLLSSYDKADRRIYLYDGVSLTDSINVHSIGSLDYHMYIDLLK